MWNFFNRNKIKDAFINKTTEDIVVNYKRYPTPYKLLYDNKGRLKHFDGLQEPVVGRATLSSILNIRLSLLCGEGVQVRTDVDIVRNWVKRFLRDTLLDNKTLISLAEQLELYGYISCNINVDKTTQQFSIKINKKAFGDIVVLKNDLVPAKDQLTVMSFIVPQCIHLEQVLERANDIGELGTKATPAITGLSQDEVKNVLRNLKSSGWKKSNFIATTGNFAYHTPSTAPVDGLKTEVSLIVKDIGSKTGIPPHWLGWTDLMSNRSTAETLTTFMESFTQVERSTLRIAVEKIIMSAQYMAKTMTSKNRLSKIDENIEVDIPTLSNNKFISSIQAYAILYNSGAITLQEFRSIAPGISPTTPEELLNNKPALDEIDEFDAPEPDTDE